MACRVGELTNDLIVVLKLAHELAANDPVFAMLNCTLRPSTTAGASLKAR
jgi:hypothetical protein